MHFLIALVLALVVVFSFGVASNNIDVVTLDHWQGVAQTPAQRAGLTGGEVIVSVNGKALTNPRSFTGVVKRSVGKPVVLGVQRDGKLLHITVVPADGRGVKAD